ncbi:MULTISPECIES: PspC domain-containing protein [unclassified Streptococcus]|uniref:PspC domain-containing protein n=1 Tax=unclassified Streptococcus TaxID=2608887 RepID=UPI0010729A2C|nr:MULTISPECIES: PspC domain-containing protein [unclassified Streptococcus]MBF0788234.1 PspC domain-containing protein [Streptococcus sp. 19428wC2_LYSM12]MCQ9212187.1 PspC domain-containing protein [Streptococcus sp. B01]MCQ9213517.1 PspC domain-containing protein [Streptococcus sp. O1]TFV04702.1 PspC domain-containing protein [Streptococcus sp. LYSM12]
MSLGFYKQRSNKLISGVLAGLASRFHWDLSITRIVFAIICLLGRPGLLAIAAYILAAVLLPFKEDVDAERYGTGPRKVKEAEKIYKHK